MNARHLAIALGALLAAGARLALAEAPPAGGAADLLRALEASPASVVGNVGEPRRLDERAYTAKLTVEEPLTGPIERGAVVAIAWEERSPSRAVRFRKGDRLLLALEPLPGMSIWRERVPELEERLAMLFVARGGGAFLRAPSLGSEGLLKHFLALPPELRERNAGVGYLIELAEGAQLQLAEACVERLAAVRRLDAEIDPTSAQRLVRALLRPDASDDLRVGILGLVERGPLESLRPPLTALLSGEALPPALALDALGRLDDGLPAPLVARLLASGAAAEYRALGARYASGPAEARLPELLRTDSSPAVRIGAVERWVELRGVDGIDYAIFALDDADPTVRRAALAAIGRLGPPAVPALREVIDKGPTHAARAAVGALLIAGGPEAARTLAEIAENHPDEGVRALARTALGRPIGHRHP